MLGVIRIKADWSPLYLLSLFELNIVELRQPDKAIPLEDIFEEKGHTS
jgi:hypothetical protein